MSSLRHSHAARSSTSATSQLYALRRDGQFQVRQITGEPRDCRPNERPTPFSSQEAAIKVARYLNGQLEADDAMFEVEPYPPLL